MLRALAVASLSCASAQDIFLGSRTSGDYPMPEVQTSGQKATMDRFKVLAKTASDAVTPQLLAFFDSADFRTALNKCCSGVASLSSQELLEALRAEIRVAEICHHASGSTKNMNEEIGLAWPWFLNIDQCDLIKQGTQELHSSLQPGFSIEDNEDFLFGTPPYADRSHKTWDEAASRLIYIAHNLRQVDVGSPIFGTASACFSTEYAKDMVLIAPMDTGAFSMQCSVVGPTDTVGADRGGENCTSWDPQVVGTYDHHDHIIMASFDTWTPGDQNTRVDQAAELFSRSALADGGYPALPPTTSQQAKKYYEANILGNPRYPDGIKHLVAVFSAHFATDSGARLQEWANKYNWPMLWALGDVNGGGGHRRRKAVPGGGSFPGNQRVLDSTVTRFQSLNATAPNGATDAFAELWQTVANARQSGTPSAAQFNAWWEQLKATQVNLAPSTARGCATPDACVGIDITTNDCIC